MAATDKDATPPVVERRSETTRMRVAEEQSTAARIEVPLKLKRPHALLAPIAKAFATETPQLDGLLYPPSCHLDITTSPASMDRALRIMDALLKALDTRGLRVEITEPQERDSWSRRDGRKHRITSRVIVDGERIAFSLKERRRYRQRDASQPSRPDSGKTKPVFPRASSYVPNGEFVLAIEAPGGTMFKDTRHGRVEDQLNAFVAELWIAADEIKERRAEQAEAQQRAAREAEANDKLRRRKARYERRVEGLLEKLDRWRIARDIRDYVREIRATVAPTSIAAIHHNQLERQLRWALRHADRIDPVSRLRRELLELTPAS